MRPTQTLTFWFNRPRLLISVPGGPETVAATKPPIRASAKAGGFMQDPISTIAHLGTVWAGDSLPYVDIKCVWTNGGYMNITGTLIECQVRRWDAKRHAAIGDVLVDVIAKLISPTTGDALIDWFEAAPSGTVPLESGWYVLQADVIFQDGHEQHSQRAVFRVMEP